MEKFRELEKKWEAALEKDDYEEAIRLARLAIKERSRAEGITFDEARMKFAHESLYETKVLTDEARRQNLI